MTMQPPDSSPTTANPQLRPRRKPRKVSRLVCVEGTQLVRADAQTSLVETSVQIRQDPEKVEPAFLAKEFVQATLPHRDPGDVRAWGRSNGELTLSLLPGRDRNGESLGLPYGTLPRLVLFWITTEAVRTKSRRLELGPTLTDFMRALGLNPSNGGRGAKRSDARRLKEQMQRLFRATISFTQTVDSSVRTADRWRDMAVAPEGDLWWDPREPDQEPLWGSWIELGEKFYEAITRAPVPVDLRALRALRRSPLALDLYAWATYTAYQTQKTGKARVVQWAWLCEQFGTDYATVDDFRRKAKAALRKVCQVYPPFRAAMKYERGGLRVMPCLPAIPMRPKAVRQLRPET